MSASVRKSHIKSGLLGLVTGAALLVCFSGTHNRNTSLTSAGAEQLSRFPQIVLWAWEKPEDLSFIDPHTMAVAYLAATINLSGSLCTLKPRLQPLTVPPATQMMSVVRLQVDRSNPPRFDSAQLEKAVSLIVAEAKPETASALQIDFDAPLSARTFYCNLLFEVRRCLPRGFPLSMTALASWCIGDNWLSDLPVDEAVPMLFRMGADTTPVLNHLASGGDFRARPARSSLGISVDEPLSVLPSGRRIYIFDPKPWSESDLKNAIQRLTDSD